MDHPPLWKSQAFDDDGALEADQVQIIDPVRVDLPGAAERRVLLEPTSSQKQDGFDLHPAFHERLFPSWVPPFVVRDRFVGWCNGARIDHCRAIDEFIVQGSQECFTCYFHFSQDNRGCR